MSLVGQRPPIPAEVERYDDWQRRRFSMKLDLQYIDNWSLGLDSRLLLKTVAAVLLGQGR